MLDDRATLWLYQGRKAGAAYGASLRRGRVAQLEARSLPPWGAGLALQSASPSAWAFPIHLTRFRSPQDQWRTAARFWRGRTISFSLRELLRFVPCAHNRVWAAVTRVDR